MVTKLFDIGMFLIIASLIVLVVMHPQAASSLINSGGNFLVTQEKTFAGYGYN